MSKESASRSTVALLWWRLMTLGIVGLVFAEALLLAANKVQGWSFYLTPSELVFELVVRLIFAALAGMLLGTLCTAVVGPFLWLFPSSGQSIATWVTKAGVVLVLFLDSRFALTTLIKWSNRGVRFTSALLVAHFLVFVIALLIPRGRKELVGSLDDFMGEKMSRRTAIATVAGAAALAGTEFAMGSTARTVKAALATPRPKSNFLLITFDALCAEDLSLYGSHLPTSPNIDAFARKATVFSNYYSASTFTTPSVATMLTGVYPSESHVHQLQGRVRAAVAGRTLPHAMRAGGYYTAAFASNPFAYYLAQSVENGFDELPEPTFQPGGLAHLWSATAPLHQDSGFGSRIDEYADLEGMWNLVFGMPGNLSMRLRPETTFGHAREMFAKLPDGFFLWVHVITPHQPYIPDPADRGRFLPYDEQRRFEEEESETLWKPHYSPDRQPLVDRRRLLYDEFVSTADRAFGTFMSELENSGKLQNTTVVVSADHGESFEGGVYQHSSPYLTRPVVHIPLIVRTPGQQDSRRVDFTADQTALAPTILELAGQPKPDWMRGPSLAGWLSRKGQGAGEGLAFTQYLEKNSEFRPLRHGMVGAIDGQYEYVFDLDSQKGALRPLQEAHIWNLDRSAENPAQAAALRDAIFSRFPELMQKP